METSKNSPIKKSSTLIFFGNERLSSGFSPQGAPTLQALIDNGYHVAAVVAHHQEARSRKQRPLEIEAVAKAHNIPVLLPNRLRDCMDELAALKPTAGILVAFGKIIPQDLIDIFPRGIINIHPSLLPQHRGPTPIEQAILDGQPDTGVSLMQLSKEMDAGAIFAQEKVTLSGNETKQQLTQQLLSLGGKLLIEHLPAILDGTLTPTPQDESKATYCQLLQKTDGIIDFKTPAAATERRIRAFAGWPQTRVQLEINGQSFDIIVTAAAVDKLPLEIGEIILQTNAVLVGTSQGSLAITSLKIPGKKEMAAGDFIRGYLK